MNQTCHRLFRTIPLDYMPALPAMRKLPSSRCVHLICQRGWRTYVPFIPLVITSSVVAAAARDTCPCEDLIVQLPDFSTEVVEMFADFVIGKTVCGDADSLRELSDLMAAMGVHLHTGGVTTDDTEVSLKIPVDVLPVREPEPHDDDNIKINADIVNINEERRKDVPDAQIQSTVQEKTNNNENANIEQETQDTLRENTEETSVQPTLIRKHIIHLKKNGAKTVFVSNPIAKNRYIRDQSHRTIPQKTGSTTGQREPKPTNNANIKCKTKSAVLDSEKEKEIVHTNTSGYQNWRCGSDCNKSLAEHPPLAICDVRSLAVSEVHGQNAYGSAPAITQKHRTEHKYSMVVTDFAGKPHRISVKPHNNSNIAAKGQTKAEITAEKRNLIAVPNQPFRLQTMPVVSTPDFQTSYMIMAGNKLQEAVAGKQPTGSIFNSKFAGRLRNLRAIPICKLNSGVFVQNQAVGDQDAGQFEVVSTGKRPATTVATGEPPTKIHKDESATSTNTTAVIIDMS